MRMLFKYFFYKTRHLYLNEWCLVRYESKCKYHKDEFWMWLHKILCSKVKWPTTWSTHIEWMCGTYRKTLSSNLNLPDLTHFDVSVWCKVCGCYFVPFFMFSNFYWLDLHKKIGVALANLWWNTWKNHTKNQISPNFNHGYWKCMLVDFLTI